jgi:hypothetical protein
MWGWSVAPTNVALKSALPALPFLAWPDEGVEAGGHLKFPSLRKPLARQEVSSPDARSFKSTPNLRHQTSETVKGCGGSVQFFRILEAWRAEGELRDVELR